MTSVSTSVAILRPVADLIATEGIIAALSILVEDFINHIIEAYLWAFHEQNRFVRTLFSIFMSGFSNNKRRNYDVGR